MTGADRFAGLLAATRPGSRTPSLARVLTPPDESSLVPLAPERDVLAPPHGPTTRQLRAQAERDIPGRVGLSWQPASAARAATHRRLTDPLLPDVWGERLIPLSIDVTAFGPAGEVVRTLQELSPHEAFLGGPP